MIGSTAVIAKLRARIKVGKDRGRRKNIRVNEARRFCDPEMMRVGCGAAMIEVRKIRQSSGFPDHGTGEWCMEAKLIHIIVKCVIRLKFVCP